MLDAKKGDGMKRIVAFLCLSALGMSPLLMARSLRAKHKHLLDRSLKTHIALPEVSADSNSNNDAITETVYQSVQDQQQLPMIPDSDQKPVSQVSSQSMQAETDNTTSIDQMVEFTSSKPSEPFQTESPLPVSLELTPNSSSSMPQEQEYQDIVLPAAPLQTVEAQTVQSLESQAGPVVSRIMEPVTIEPESVTVVKTQDDSITRLLEKGNEGFDEEARRKVVVSLVNNGINYLQTHSMDQAFDTFSHASEFLNGELYLFVLDMKGNVYAHGGELELVWKNIWNMRDQFNTPIIQNIIKKAQDGGGWILYHWNGSTKVSYVKPVTKEGKTFVIGCGYYPHSKSEQTIGLVKGAVGLFNQLVREQKYPVEEAFSSYTYPMGRFILGDLYIYVLDFQGTIYAQGERPGLIGTNSWFYKDSRGKFVNQSIIQKLQNVPLGAGIWDKYYSKNAPKLTYAEAVEDLAGKRYFIACGYYPLSTREKAIQLVKKGYDYMKRQGKMRASEAISSKRDDSFRYGDLSLAVFNMQGEVVANGDNPETIGINFYNAQDEDGMYYVQALLKKAQGGGGWINLQSKNSFESAYCEPIELGLEKYVITCGLFPVSKQETALLMVRSASSYLRTNSKVESLRAFSDKAGNFIRGDLYVTVYDSRGIVLVQGADNKEVLKNKLNATDDNGKPYVSLLINAVKRGPAKVTYKLRGAQRVDFAEQVEKDGSNYIVVVGYYY